MTFKPGESGNPTGRPLGARDKATVTFERIMRQEAGGALRKICRAAARGDVEMATIFAAHVLPRLVPLPVRRPVRFKLTDPTSAAAILADLAVAVALGELDPSEAEKISALARARVEAVDLAQMNLTLRRLEARHAGIGDDGMATDHPPRPGNGSGSELP